MSAAWSVTYETATIQAGTAPTKEQAERIAVNVHDSYVVKGLNPDALAWHVEAGVAREDVRACIAMAALHGLIAHSFRDNENNGLSLIGPAYAAKEAVAYADALVAALEKAAP